MYRIGSLSRDRIAIINKENRILVGDLYSSFFNGVEIHGYYFSTKSMEKEDVNFIKENFHILPKITIDDFNISTLTSNIEETTIILNDAEIDFIYFVTYGVKCTIRTKEPLPENIKTILTLAGLNDEY